MLFLDLTDRRQLWSFKGQGMPPDEKEKAFLRKIFPSNINWISDSFRENFNSRLIVDFGV